MNKILKRLEHLHTLMEMSQLINLTLDTGETRRFAIASAIKLLQAEALVETIEIRDPYTGGHTRRVMNYCLMIGKSIGLSKKELENLQLAAILHDVGKICVRDDVLLKNGKLKRDEFEKMVMHAKYGAEILSHVKQMKDVIPGVRSHHERIDGKGYPDNLKDNDIPTIAKIIAVADTFDAMTTDRPYRKAMSHEAAFEELRNNSGIQFDEDIVDTFMKVYQEKESIL